MDRPHTPASVGEGAAEALHVFISLCRSLGGDLEAAVACFNHPHTALGGVSPMALTEEGRGRLLQSLVASGEVDLSRTS